MFHLLVHRHRARARRAREHAELLASIITAETVNHSFRAPSEQLPLDRYTRHGAERRARPRKRTASERQAVADDLRAWAARVNAQFGGAGEQAQANG